VAFAVLVTLATTAALAALGPQIVIKEWDIGTPKGFPHDPAVAPDGSLWYTGMTANVLKRYREQ
jgi:streptogramin lyase